MKSRYPRQAVTGLIHRLTLVRHANAEDAREGVFDRDRRLTPWGKTQARRIRDKLKSHLFNFTHSFHSPTLRATQTRAVVLEVTETAEHEVISLFPTPPPEGDVLTRYFKEFGHSPYRRYFEIEECRRALLLLGFQTLDTILDTVGDDMPEKPINCIVFGHAVFLPALAHALLGAGSSEGVEASKADWDWEFLMNLNLGEAEAVSLVCDDSSSPNAFRFENHLRP